MINLIKSQYIFIALNKKIQNILKHLKPNNIYLMSDYLFKIKKHD